MEKKFIINRVDLGQRVTGYEVFNPAVNGGEVNGIYKACILNGISYKAYADQMGVSYQSVQNAIRLIQKKAKNIFG